MNVKVKCLFVDVFGNAGEGREVELFRPVRILGVLASKRRKDQPVIQEKEENQPVGFLFSSAFRRRPCCC